MKRLKKSEPKKSSYLFGLVLIVVVLCLAAVGFLGGENGSVQTPVPETQEPVQEQPQEQTNTQNMSNSLQLVQTGRYSGMFVEDGSDELVQDILAITVENTGEKTVQLASLTLTAKSGEIYEFELTTLPPGEKLAVLEKNRAPYDSSMEIASVQSGDVIVFDEEPTLCEDVLEFSCADRSVTVKNISDKDISGGRVFYKSVSGNTLVGGITYMLTIPALRAGQETTLSAGHYLDGASRLIFATYAN